MGNAVIAQLEKTLEEGRLIKWISVKLQPEKIRPPTLTS
jgi:hypothetical protein